MTVPTRTPAERFANILRCLTQAVVVRSHFGLSSLLIGLIVDRIREIKQRFARLAALIREGKYVPRRFAPRRKPAETRPRPGPPNKLPRKFGWLLKLVPEAVGYRSQLEHLFRDPAFSALLAAAPTSLGRPLRSL